MTALISTSGVWNASNQLKQSDYQAAIRDFLFEQDLIETVILHGAAQTVALGI
jgi:hypothetical protein